ncbi:hypothetical protein QFC20_007495 [Naganishia adeliensis]|uniref:Uncharacterized protein n=1 Tax=Naganishia adeliensis TaxID=92952 RepID=A0ACC2UYE4_9TREE|nr:hypothetical protein QFC20_007495 [Naganishia adeliensis]
MREHYVLGDVIAFDGDPEAHGRVPFPKLTALMSASSDDVDDGGVDLLATSLPLAGGRWAARRRMSSKTAVVPITYSGISSCSSPEEVQIDGRSAQDAIDNGIRLPYDILEVVSRILADDVDYDWHSPLQALARLNRTSRAVHEVTLPILYRRTYLDTEEAFKGMVGRENPQGFKHTKYLYLNPVTFALFKLQQRYLLGSFECSDEDLDFSPI